jgi:DNA polymerase III delta subunit
MKLINKKDGEWLKKNKNAVEANVVIYHKGVVTKTALKILPKPDKIEEFKLPKLIWNFLDSFYPGNAKNCLNLLHEIVKKEPIELVFFLLVKQVRDVYWARVGSPPGQRPSGPVAYPPWRVAKLKKQALKFDENVLKKVINDFANADIKSKTSKAKLIDSLDFIIATKLE